MAKGALIGASATVFYGVILPVLFGQFSDPSPITLIIALAGVGAIPGAIVGWLLERFE